MRQGFVARCAALFCAATTAAAAQEFRCAPLEPSSAQQPAYRRVPGDARCEGFFARTVSQPFVEVVSLTRGAAQAETSGPLALRGARAARLVIQPLRAAPFYRVDAPLDPERPFVWDPAPMERDASVPRRELGFLAVARDAGHEPVALAPVSWRREDDASPKAFAVLRASVALSALAWRAYRPGDADAARAWKPLAQPPYAWEPVAIGFELPASSDLNVDVRAHDAERNALPLLRFVVVGGAR